VVSRKIGQTVIGREIRDIAAREGFPILACEIQQRVPFAESLTLGRSIFEYAPDSPAAREIEQLTGEIESMHHGNEAKIHRRQKPRHAVA